jgi:hypothetical protein
VHLHVTGQHLAAVVEVLLTWAAPVSHSVLTISTTTLEG